MANDANSLAGYRSDIELERLMIDDREWLNEADRLMAELESLDVQLHALTQRVNAEQIQERLIRERNNVRRLMVELTSARNTVYTRLQDTRKEYEYLQLSERPMDSLRP